MRYLIIVLGSSKNIQEALNHIADSEYGIHYVDGNGIFLGTFYSPYTTKQIEETILADITAFLLFDISDKETNAVNLPSKYFKGLFPEYDETLEMLQENLEVKLRKPKNKKQVVEEYDNIDDILDKLSRNKYDRSCLTEKEIEILEKGS
ncbi:MAG: hypothetical protein ACW98X_23940 [Promethearchaeota archaeon]|jgi:hypothetical protein